LVGAILSDSDPTLAEGKKRIKERIYRKKGVIPNGIYPSKSYNDLFEEKRATDFGRNTDLLCPFFKQGKFNCTVWKYRESICALWFCKHLAGRTGQNMWNTVIKYLQFIQKNLLLNAIRTAGLEPVDLYSNNVQDKETGIDETDPAFYSQIWKNWEGKEIEYYINCFRYVERIPSEYVRGIQLNGRELESKLNKAIDSVVQIPEYLTGNYELLEQTQQNTYRIEFIHNISYLEKSVVWSFELPCIILDSFDGNKTTRQVLQQLDKKNNIKIDNAVIVSLFHHGFLLQS